MTSVLPSALPSRHSGPLPSPNLVALCCLSSPIQLSSLKIVGKLNPIKVCVANKVSCTIPSVQLPTLHNKLPQTWLLKTAPTYVLIARKSVVWAHWLLCWGSHLEEVKVSAGTTIAHKAQDSPSSPLLSAEFSCLRF